MRNIVEIGKQGAEQMDVAAPMPEVAVEGVQQYTHIVSRFPYQKMEAEVNDGTKKSVEVHTLLLNNPQVFGLVWNMAEYEPIIYARQNGKTVMGILSPNYDSHGEYRLPSIKVLPLRQAYPLISKGTDLLPDARMATMLAGSAHAEGKGSGSHNKPPHEDYEHKVTFLGAVSLGKSTITENGAHVQHGVRKRSSVATGLTDGKLGNIFVPDESRTGEFTGYGTPVIFEPGKTQPTDMVYIPKGFLEHEAAYGAHYVDAARITYGASLQIVHERLSRQVVSDRLAQIRSAT